VADEAVVIRWFRSRYVWLGLVGVLARTLGGSRGHENAGGRCGDEQQTLGADRSCPSNAAGGGLIALEAPRTTGTAGAMCPDGG